YLTENIYLAADNSPKACVLSGSESEINTLEQKLTDDGYRCRSLKTSHAFHSPMMKPALKEFLAAFKHISIMDPKVPYLSNVTGKWITAKEVRDCQYWAKHLIQTVCFHQSIKTLLEEECANIFIEVGPGCTLSGLVRQIVTDKESNYIENIVRHRLEDVSDYVYLKNVLGKLWKYGIEIKWPIVYGKSKPQKLHLPTYVFDDQTMLVSKDNDVSSQNSTDKSPIDHWFYKPVWESNIEYESKKPISNAIYLLFLERNQFSDSLKQSLLKNNSKVISVYLGKSFCEISKVEFEVKKDSPQDYFKLISSLELANNLPDIIIHTWCYKLEYTKNLLKQFDLNSERGFFGVLYLVQALMALEVAAYKCSLFIISNAV
ncbi:unnamed protein product, partial [marine sediment metagenome]